MCASGAGLYAVTRRSFISSIDDHEERERATCRAHMSVERWAFSPWLCMKEMLRDPSMFSLSKLSTRSMGLSSLCATTSMRSRPEARHADRKYASGGCSGPVGRPLAGKGIGRRGQEGAEKEVRGARRRVCAARVCAALCESRVTSRVTSLDWVEPDVYGPLSSPPSTHTGRQNTAHTTRAHMRWG